MDRARSAQGRAMSSDQIHVAESRRTVVEGKEGDPTRQDRSCYAVDKRWAQLWRNRDSTVELVSSWYSVLSEEV